MKVHYALSVGEKIVGALREVELGTPVCGRSPKHSERTNDERVVTCKWCLKKMDEELF